MSLKHKFTLNGLAIAGTCFWDSPSSDMGVTATDGGEPGGGAAGDVEGHDDAHDDADGEDRADARSGRTSADRDDEDDQDDDPLTALGSDDEDDEADGRPVDDARFRKVLKNKRRLERSLKKNAPLLARMKELREAGVSLDDLMLSHRNFANIQRQLETNPQLRALLGGEDSGSRTRETGNNRSERRDTKYPFKTDNDAGQFFQKFHEDYLDHKDTIQRELSELRELVTGVRTERAADRTNAAVKEWKSAADAAAKQIPDGFRDLFIHTIGLEMRRVLKGEIKGTPQQVIEFHLKNLKTKGNITGDTSKRASEAAREATARRNQTLPRRPTGGAPGPVKERQVPRLRDFNRNLKARFGGA